LDKEIEDNDEDFDDANLSFDSFFESFSKFLKNKYVKLGVLLFICWFFYCLGADSVDVSGCVVNNAVSNITYNFINLTI